MVFPNKAMVPGENILLDILWIIYWRWNLDYIIILGYILVVIIEIVIISQLKKKFSDDTISIYISPIITMGAAFIYVISIDSAVTFFADVYIDGNWNSTEIVLFGLNAQSLYHMFFFWIIPIIIITGIITQVYIRTDSISKTFRSFFILLGIYSLNLAFLDAVVCQILWGDFLKFGEWNINDPINPIFAQGWIAHYIILALIWFLMDYAIKTCRQEIEFMKKPELTR
jgi:hypothetical protein